MLPPSFTRNSLTALFFLFTLCVTCFSWTTYADNCDHGNKQIREAPDRPTSSIKVEDNETYDYGGKTIDGGNLKGGGLFRCIGKKGVTIKNVTVTNSPRYAIIAKGCDDFTVVNLKMENMANSVGGIRFDRGTPNKNVTLLNIEAEDIGGHAIELWDVDGFKIGKIKANNTKGCGVLLNRSKNGTVEEVVGDRNNKGGGYATFRVANDNGPNVKVGRVISTNSGRGFFSVSRSHGTTVAFVDIKDTTKEGIYIQSAKNTTVESGEVHSKVSCRIRGGSNNAIKAQCGEDNKIHR